MGLSNHPTKRTTTAKSFESVMHRTNQKGETFGFLLFSYRGLSPDHPYIPPKSPFDKGGLHGWGSPTSSLLGQSLQTFVALRLFLYWGRVRTVGSDNPSSERRGGCEWLCGISRRNLPHQVQNGFGGTIE